MSTLGVLAQMEDERRQQILDALGGGGRVNSDVNPEAFKLVMKKKGLAARLAQALREEDEDGLMKNLKVVRG